ncbi:MAG: hypothetical protein ABWK00_00520 [Desulfurococcaceae archaeon]
MRISSFGIELEVCVDRITGMYACPICGNAMKICKGIAKGKQEEPFTFFYSVDDLIVHLRDYHAKGAHKGEEGARGKR